MVREMETKSYEELVLNDKKTPHRRLQPVPAGYQVPEETETP